MKPRTDEQILANYLDGELLKIVFLPGLPGRLLVLTERFG